MKYSGWIKSGTIFGLFLTFGQISTYLVSLVSASKLSLESFGLFSSLIAVLSVLTTIGIGLQITVASAGGTHASTTLERGLRSYINAVTMYQVVGVLFLAPFVSHFLRAPLLLVLMFLASSIPMVNASGVFGLALSFKSVLAQSLCVFLPVFFRSVFLIAGMAYFSTSLMVIGILGLIGSTLGAVLIRRMVKVDSFNLIETDNNLNLFPIHLKATASVFALYLLLTADMLTARWLLDESTAGYYAAGNLITKIGFFLPSAIGLMASPFLAGKKNKKVKYVVYLLTIATGLIYAIVVSVFAHQVLHLLNSDFLISPHELLLFALSGVTISVIQIVIYENALSKNYLHPIVMMLFATLIPISALSLQISKVLDLILISLASVLACAVILLLSQRRDQKELDREHNH